MAPTETDDLHARLDALATRIDSARSTLKDREKWHDLEHLTAGELKARHSFLKAELEAEIANTEAHGHRVSNLERSVRAWIDDLDL